MHFFDSIFCFGAMRGNSQLGQVTEERRYNSDLEAILIDVNTLTTYISGYTTTAKVYLFASIQTSVRPM